MKATMLTIAIVIFAGCDNAGHVSVPVCEDNWDAGFDACVADMPVCEVVVCETVADTESLEVDNAGLQSVIVGLRADLLRAQSEADEFRGDLYFCENEPNEVKQ